MNDSKSVRILLVDSHTLVRRGLRMILSLRPGLEVIGEAGTVNEAFQLALDKQPDLILLDLILDEQDVSRIVPRLLSFCPKARLLVLSMLPIPRMIHKTIDAGVHGLVPKDITPDELTEAIQRVLDGEFYTSPKITALLKQQSCCEKLISRNELKSASLSLTKSADLTKREYEVLALMATCANNREIAQQLTVGEETVRTHVRGVLRKLNQPSRTQAVVQALRLGLIEL